MNEGFIMSPKFFIRHIVFAFAVCLSVRIKLVQPSQDKLLVGFQPNFTGVISTIPSCAHYQHISLHCTKLPQELKIEKSCPTYTGQTSGGSSTKHYRSDQYHP
jgi:hypothetical protein